MKSKDYYYALIAISALGVMSQTFELFNEQINRLLIAGGIVALAVFYLFELKNVREEGKKKKSYKFWRYFNLVNQDLAPEQKSKKSTPFGTSYTYIPPIGISSQRFNNKKMEIIEHTKADNVDINYNKGDIIIDLYHPKDADINHLK